MSLPTIRACNLNISRGVNIREHRSSGGVKTFVVGADGVLYEKDLQQNTEAIAKSMKEFNLDSSWQRSQGESQ